MLKVEIDNNQAKPENIEARSGTKNGRDWSMRSQSIWVYKPDQKFPVQINFVLPSDVDLYPAGLYTLDLDSAFDQGNFKSIMLDTRSLVLVPSKTSAIPK